MNLSVRLKFDLLSINYLFNFNFYSINIHHIYFSCLWYLFFIDIQQFKLTQEIYDYINNSVMNIIKGLRLY